MNKLFIKIHTFILLQFFFVQQSFTQNLTGTWLGIGNDYRIVLIQVGDSCFGYTYDTGMGFCKANFKGSYDSTEKKLKGANPSFIERTLSHSLSSYKLNYSKEGADEYLRGRLTAKSLVMKIISFGIGSPIAYRKVSNEYDTTKLMAAKLAGQAIPEVAVIEKDSIVPEIVVPVVSVEEKKIRELSIQKENRKSELVNTIATSADSLRITLHDNGEIDNDTVTVFLNGKIIVNQLGLTAKAYETFIPLSDKNAVYSIELMANNLGSIPPNTAYLTIWAGKEKYELRVSSDFSVNARIDVTCKPKE